MMYIPCVLDQWEARARLETDYGSASLGKLGTQTLATATNEVDTTIQV